MRTALLLAALLILSVCGGSFAFAIHTKRIARTRMLLHLLGDRFTVRATIAPLWGIAEPIGAYQYCERIYSVTFTVAK